MSDYRSDAEKFVTDFLDYVHNHDILDHFDKRTQKMIRSAGVEALIKQAKAVFPPRADDGKAETDKLTEDQRDEAIKNSSNVVDTREMFAARVQKNGGVRRILRELMDGNPQALKDAEEFFAAEDGEKEFHVSTKE